MRAPRPGGHLRARVEALAADVAVERRVADDRAPLDAVEESRRSTFQDDPTLDAEMRALGLQTRHAYGLLDLTVYEGEQLVKYSRGI